MQVLLNTSKFTQIRIEFEHLLHTRVGKEKLKTQEERFNNSELEITAHGNCPLCPSLGYWLPSPKSPWKLGNCGGLVDGDWRGIGKLNILENCP